MNKLKLLIVGALALPLTCFAGEFPWLTFRMADDSELSVAADNLTITYNNRVLQLKSATVDREIPVDEVRAMQFTSSAAGLSDISGDLRTGAVEFYDMSGKTAGVYGSVDEARGSLPSGVYIVKADDKSFKIIF